MAEYYDSQDMEKTKKSIKRRMDTEELVWVHMEYQSRKKNETMPFAATWMDLEISILSKSYREKQISYDITYMWNLKK